MIRYPAVNAPMRLSVRTTEVAVVLTETRQAGFVVGSRPPDTT